MLARVRRVALTNSVAWFQYRKMRVKFILLLNLIFITLTTWADETLPMLKIGNDVYRNVTVTSVTATDIYFRSDKGMANAKLKNLEPALQRHFNFDPAKAEAIEKQQKAANLKVPFQVDIKSIDGTNAKAIMEDAIVRVKAIINQPVRKFAETSDMNAGFYTPGWFHDGAIKPDFNTVDIRTSQELPYAKNAYVTSSLNPGIVFIGTEVEFNSMTKYF